MPRTHIPTRWRQRLQTEFQNRCAYCHTAGAITGAQLVVDHIIPQAAGGQTVWGNLCLACHSCNEFKGAQSKARDPRTGRHVSLFHPRQHEWREHFRWSQDGSEIVGLTSVGRATVAMLNLNHFFVVHARRRWVLVGWHPPRDDL
jgi:HNH endonuclease